MGACVRTSPTGLLICFKHPSCDFQHKSLDDIKLHIKIKHSTAVCGKAVLFPALLESGGSEGVKGKAAILPVAMTEDPTATYDLADLPGSSAHLESGDSEGVEGEAAILPVAMAEDPTATYDLADLPGSSAHLESGDSEGVEGEASILPVEDPVATYDLPMASDMAALPDSEPSQGGRQPCVQISPHQSPDPDLPVPSRPSSAK